MKVILFLIHFFCLIFLFCILFPSCGIFEKPKEDVVITVGSTEITEDELIREIKKITFEMGITDQEVKQGIRVLVDKIIDNFLILEYGKEKGVTLSGAELESAINQIKKDYPDDVFKEVLLQNYIEYNEWIEWLKRDLLLTKIVNSVLIDQPTVKFQEAKDYYESHRKDFERPEMVELAQIVLSTKDQADMVLAQLSDGEDMEELAKKYSITPEGKDGGLLGWIEKGSLQETIENKIFPLPLNTVSEIIKTSYGYHIFKVLERRSAGIRTLSESMTEIEERLSIEKKEQFYQKWITGLRGRLGVRVDQKIYNDWSMEG